jgi:hypothetical protein
MATNLDQEKGSQMQHQPLQHVLKSHFALDPRRTDFIAAFIANRTRGSCSDPAPSGGGLGSRSRSNLFEEVGSTTILLVDDLEDQGAVGSFVLGPAPNLQGAVL